MRLPNVPIYASFVLRVTLADPPRFAVRTATGLKVFANLDAAFLYIQNALENGVQQPFEE